VEISFAQEEGSLTKKAIFLFPLFWKEFRVKSDHQRIK
jgi:hypothetical protein